MDKMGSIFLSILCIVSFFKIDTALAQIDLPDTPEPQPVPQISEQKNRQQQRERKKDLEQKLETTEEKLKLEEQKKKEKEEESYAEALLLAKRDLNWAVSLNLHYTKITTTGSARKNYRVDPAVATNFWYRISQKNKSDDLNVWAGLRVHNFSGRGTYKDRTGRFSFTYFGPTIGLGKISPSQNNDVKNSIANPHGSVKSGFLLMTGIAAQSRQGHEDHDYAKAEDDINTKTIAFDRPGLYGELWYTRVWYNSWGFNAVFGAQSGIKKSFVYSGLGVSLWN